MIQDNELSERHVLPRWTSISAAKAAGELARPHKSKPSIVRLESQKRSKQVLAEELEKRKRSWKESINVSDAEELVATAIVAGATSDPEVIRAAEKIISDGGSGQAVLSFAESLLSSDTPTSVQEIFGEAAETYSAISRRKRLLELNPRDVMLLTETALLHANLGQPKSSERLLRRALALSKHSRYVLRSAARFYCHIGRPDKALDVLKTSGRVAVDPWLSAAEMAVSAVAESTNFKWRKAADLLKDESFSNLDRSELAAEVATLELAAGGRRRASKAVELCVKHPTENAIAQVEFLARKGDFTSDVFNVDLSRSMEAAAQHSFAASDFSNALNACQDWQNIEPFSVRPAIFGTFMSTASTNNLERGLAIGQRGLIGNPSDGTLLNNMAVLNAYLGNTDRAWEFSNRSQLNRDMDREITGIATKGLIHFRQGQYKTATALYEEAILNAVSRKQYAMALRAYCFFAREMAFVDSSLAAQFSKEISEIVEKMSKANIVLTKDIEIIRDHLDSIRAEQPIAKLPFKPLEIELVGLAS